MKPAIILREIKIIEIRNAIFDFDGLLVKTEKLHFESWNAALAKYGKQIGIEQYRPYCGKPGTENARSFRKLFNLPISRKGLYGMKNDLCMEQIRKSGVPLMDGADEITAFFNSHNVPIAIATGGKGSENEAKFAKFPLMDRFDVIATGDDVKRNKPWPDLIEFTCKKMGADPKKTAGFDDSRTGVIALRRAGVYVFGVPTEYSIRKDVENIADVTFSNLNQALEFIKKSIVSFADGVLYLQVKR